MDGACAIDESSLVVVVLMSDSASDGILRILIHNIGAISSSSVPWMDLPVSLMI